MADILTIKQRSFNMSRIRNKDTSIELKLRKSLYANGVRGYRLHYKITGKPDFVFVGKKVAVFIDGCFWHKCSKCFVRPKTRKKFWDEKIAINVKRDRRANRLLKKDNWIVIRFWEHDVNNRTDKVVSRIIQLLS